MTSDPILRALGASALLMLSSYLRAETPADTSAESSSKLATVVVTASPLTTDPDALATIVDVVARDEVLRQGGANLADSLRDVPGVTGTGFAAGASRPVIRGFDAQRVRTLEDGVGSFDVSDVGPDHGVPIDPLSSQQVEVVRGAATLRYGSQAIGGVVNSINNRVPTQLPDAPISGEATGLYGSNANTGQGSLLLDGRAGDFALHADGFIRHADDYDIPGGTQANSFLRGDGYSFGSSYFFGPQSDQSHLGLAVIHYDAKYGIPSDTTYIDMRQTKELLRSSFAIDAGALKTLTVEGGYGDYQHTENNPDGSVNSTFKDQEWDARAETLFGAIGPLSQSALGMQFQHKSFSALGEDRGYLFPTLTESQALFAFTEAPLAHALKLQLGARIEHVKVDGTPISNQAVSRDFNPASGSLGLVFDASEAVRLGLTASSAARAPAQTELFARGPHDGPGTFETGDPTLGMERANSLEASVRVRGDAVRFDGSLWGTKFNNYIYGRLTGRTCDEDNMCVSDDSQEFKELFYTQAAAKFYGAEAKLTWTFYDGPTGQFGSEILGDYVRAKFDEGGNVPRIPPYHVGVGLNWSHQHFDASVLAKYSGAQNDVAAAETPTSGFLSLDAECGWRSLSRPGLEFVLIGRNLTDSTQRDAVAFNKDVVVLPGRDVRLLARLNF